METYRLQYDDGSHEEVTAGELDRATAGREVDRMVRLYLRDHPHADYAEGLRRVLDTHPKLKAEYTGGAPSVPEQLRMAGAAGAVETIVEHGTLRYRVHEYPAPAAPSDWGTFVPPAGVAIEIGYPTGRAIWTPIRAEFDPAVWSVTEIERWLGTLGFKDVLVHTDREGPRDRRVPGGQPAPVRYWALVSDEAFQDFPRRTLRG